MRVHRVPGVTAAVELVELVQHFQQPVLMVLVVAVAVRTRWRTRPVDVGATVQL